MPCYRCATRQSDPGKGPSDWKRGVVNGEQVLVCPSCQQSHNWIGDLDRCTCGSTMLTRALGETRCRSCGLIVTDAAADADRDRPRADATLAADVSAALERRFGSYPDPTVP